MIFDYEELENEEGLLMEYLSENLLHILVKLNQQQRLQDLYKLIDYQSDLLPKECAGYSNYTTGKILVIGESQAPNAKILAVAKDLGIDAGRIELKTAYKDAKSYNFSSIQWNPGYSAIFVGPMPHKGNGSGDYASIISMLENTDGYPPVRKVGNNTLKFSKSAIETAFRDAIAEGIIQ